MSEGNKYTVTVSVPGHKVEKFTVMAAHSIDAINMGLMGVFQNPENSKSVPGIRVTAEAVLHVVGVAA